MKTLIVRHHSIRRVGGEGVTATLSATGVGGLMNDIEIDSQAFQNDIDHGEWTAVDFDLWEHVKHIRSEADHTDNTTIHYFGLPEVPLALSFGAYLGSDRYVHVYPYNAQNDSWTWPATERTLDVEVTNVPSDVSPASGPAVIRIAISSPIADSAVREILGTHAGPDVTVRPQSVIPSPGTALVRSRADAETVRDAVRRAIDGILLARPNVSVLHLFVSAPMPVCVLVGQTLTPRNSIPIQTYRYRVENGIGRYTVASRIATEGPVITETALTEAQRTRAAEIRHTIWPSVITDLNRYLGIKRREQTATHWYETLTPRWLWAKAAPFPHLPAFVNVTPDDMTVDEAPYERAAFAYERAGRRWRLSDGLLVRLDAMFGDTPAHLAAAIRLFMFHEIVHQHHSIAKASVAEVGKFPNALEHVDYTADLYAIAHELDYRILQDPNLESTDKSVLRMLGELLDSVLRSFWTFDSRNPRNEMEVRRIRRYLNWYWQLSRVRHAKTATQAAAVLARKPIVEVAGTMTRAHGRRHYASLLCRDPDVGLELALVTDGEGLHRIPDSAQVRVVSILEGLNDGDHNRLVIEFTSVFENAEHAHAALPVDPGRP